MKFVMALDQGTTSSRAILFDRHSHINSLAQSEFQQHFPRSGWVEHDAEEIWRTQLQVAREAISRIGAGPREVAAIGITNQRETVVLWDRKTGRPVHRALVWQDRRTADQCARLKAEGVEPMLRKKTGLVADPYFSATKIAWLLDELPGLRRRAESGEIAFGTIDSWILWNLTGGKVHATDVSNASRTLLLNLQTTEWDPELLELFRIPRAMLPEIRSNSEHLGVTRLFGSEIAITGMAGDQQAALFGQNCFEPGMAKNTYGTGCFMLMQTGEKPIESAHRLLTTVAWKMGGRTEYALEGSVFVAGAAIQWLRDGLQMIRSSAEVEELAGSVPDTGGVYLVPAFAGLGAPHWDPFARGSIQGITRGTTRAQIVRAALESIALQSYELLEAMEQDSRLPLRELRVDGGATVNNLLMQFQSDLLQVPVIRPRITETTAMGAAFLAGLAVGFWESRKDLVRHWEPDRSFLPSRPPEWRVPILRGWHEAVKRSREWAS